MALPIRIKFDSSPTSLKPHWSLENNPEMEGISHHTDIMLPRIGKPILMKKSNIILKEKQIELMASCDELLNHRRLKLKDSCNQSVHA